MRFDGLADHQVSEAIYIHDPDLNGIEIYIDLPKSQWKWTVKNNMRQLQMATLSLNTKDLLQQSTDKGWTGMPKDVIIGHVHLHVSNLSKAMKFYHGMLGMNLRTTYPGVYFFAAWEISPSYWNEYVAWNHEHPACFARKHRIESFWYRATKYRRF